MSLVTRPAKVNPETPSQPYHVESLLLKMMPVTAILVLMLILIPIIFAGMILNLIDRAARMRQRPVKMYLVDLFSLIFLIQIPWAIRLQLKVQPEQMAAWTTVAAISSAVMVLIWWITITTVSKAGINRVSARAQISILVIPMTYVGSFAMIAIGTIILTSYREQEQPVGGFAAIEFVLAFLMILSLHVTRRCIQTGDLQQSTTGDNVKVASPFDD